MSDPFDFFAQSLRSAGQALAEGIRLHDVIGASLESAADLEAWRHPLGFTHVELTRQADCRDDERLRLHLWSGSMRIRGDDAGTVHEHTWGLTSLVLRGAIRDRNYRPVERLAGRYQGARVEYGARNKFVQAGRYDLDLIADRRVDAGSVYRIPPRIVHETEVEQFPTVTLVLATGVRAVADPGPLLLSKEGSASSGTPVRKKVDTAGLRRELQSALLS